MLNSLSWFADAQAASDTLRAGISPIFSAMVTIAAALCVLFIVFGGYYYMTSAGNPEKLAHAKKTLRNAFIGFVVVLGAGTLVAIMQNAYTSKPVQPLEVAVEQPKEVTPSGLGDVINEAIKNFIQSAVTSIGQPVVDILKTFTSATPLLAQNGAVFNVWVVMVAITDVLFLLVVAAIGFRIMSASVIGLGDVELRSLVPQVILAFILANLSIFAIDAIITVSNAMIHALLMGMSNDIIWAALGTLITSIATVNIGILLLIAIAIILAVMLLIYYLQRMIVLYVGAVLSPLIVLLWLLPSFKDFAIAAAKTYIITIFVLFVHVSILMLAVSLFSSLVQGNGNPFMTSLLGIATLLVLLKTSRTMNQMAMLTSGNQGIRKLGNTFISGASHIITAIKQSPPGVTVVRMKDGAGVAATRPPTISSTPLATGQTRQASHKEAATILTDKKSSREAVIAKGISPNTVSVTTERPSRNIQKEAKK